MPCDRHDSPRDCLTAIVAVPMLAAVEIRDGQYGIRCPAHRDTQRSGSLALGRGQPVIWRCHQSPPCGQERIRAALIEAGVHAACLVPSTRRRRRGDDPAGQLAAIKAALGAGSPACWTILDIALIADGCEVPAGQALAGWAASRGVSRAEAYRWRAARMGGRA